MSIPPRINLTDAIRKGIRKGAMKLRVSVPARVESFDPEKQRVSVKPLIPDVDEDDFGEKVIVKRAVIHNVPVQQHRGGGYSQLFPLRPGDLVTLLFTDRSLDAFLAGRRDVDPGDPRMHHDNDPVALLGAHDFEDPPPGGTADHMSLGREEGLRIHFHEGSIDLGADAPPYAVALAEKVKAELEALRATVAALVTAFNAHGHAVATTGSASAQTGSTTSLTGTGSPADPPPVVQDMGSTKIKAVE